MKDNKDLKHILFDMNAKVMENGHPFKHYNKLVHDQICENIYEIMLLIDSEVNVSVLDTHNSASYQTLSIQQLPNGEKYIGCFVNYDDEDRCDEIIPIKYIGNTKILLEIWEDFVKSLS